MDNSSINEAQGFRIRGWQVRPRAGELIAADGTISHLEPKVMDVLVELARAWPDVLERETVIGAVWQGRPVSDDALAKCIAVLRKSLGDSTSAPRYIQTVPKRGYRLVAHVEPIASSAPASSGVPVADDAIEDWSGPLEFDNLKILRKLGRGSMGVVHLAQETNLERLVAVKTLRGIISGDDRAMRRFHREAAAAARIDHPNVTRIYRLGDIGDGTPYIVMQYVRGRTLSGLMTSSGDVSMEAALAIVRQLAGALHAAHRERIIHRDIKPGNVLIETETNLVLLSDFGLAGIQETGARVATRLTLHGEVLGDARYISPEQARGDQPTPASDIYSLGIIAYELLAGRYPYRDDGADGSSHLSETPPALSTINNRLDPAIERIVMQCLAKSPEDRPTADQVLAAVNRQADPARVASAGAATNDVGKRRPMIVFIIAAAVLSAVVAALLLL